MSENLLLVLATAVVNGAITWGVISTKLDWLRVDLDRALARLDKLEATA